MVVPVNIYRHMQLDTLSVSVFLVRVRVLHHQDQLLLLLLDLTITVNLVQKIAVIYLHTTCLTLYGMEMVVLQAITSTVAPIITYHGFNIT